MGKYETKEQRARYNKISYERRRKKYCRFCGHKLAQHRILLRKYQFCCLLCEEQWGVFSKLQKKYQKNHPRRGNDIYVNYNKKLAIKNELAESHD